MCCRELSPLVSIPSRGIKLYNDDDSDFISGIQKFQSPLGESSYITPKLAQFELTLLGFNPLSGNQVI